MGALDFFRRPKIHARRAVPSGVELFDDEFQRRLETLAIVSRRVFAGRSRAERRSSKKGSGVEFADHKSYVAGDDFRFIDWNLYQRFGRLLIRLYEEEEDLSIYFLLDCSASMAFSRSPKFDQAKRLCAALAYVGLANLDRVTLLGVSQSVTLRLPPTRGKNRIFKVFEFLQRLEAQGATNLRDAANSFVAQHKRRGLVVVVSDFYDPAGFEAGLNTLRYNKFEPYVLHVVDPREAHPDLRGDVRVYDCETGEERDVTITDALLGRVAHAYEQYAQELEHFCTKSHIPYFRAGTNQPFDELVLRVFRRGGFLR